MKRTTIFCLLIFLVMGTMGCERVTSAQPELVGSTEVAASQPAAPTETSLAVEPPVTQTPEESSKVLEVDSPIGQEVETVELTPTSIAVEITETNVPPVVQITPVTVSPTEISGVEGQTEYTLKKGEWAVCIARRYNLDLDAFFALNKINMQSNYLPEGSKLLLPAGTTWSEKYGARFWHAHPDAYTVKGGETIYQIACYYGDISPKIIEEANGLSGSYPLSAGQKLNIP